MIAGSRTEGSDQGDGGVVAQGVVVQGVGGGEGGGGDDEEESDDAWLYESDSLVSRRMTHTNKHVCVRARAHKRTYAHICTHA